MNKLIIGIGIIIISVIPIYYCTEIGEAHNRSIIIALGIYFAAIALILVFILNKISEICKKIK